MNNKFFYAMCILQACLVFILMVSLVLSYLHYIPENTYVVQNGIIIFLTLIMLLQLKNYLEAQTKTRDQSETIHNIQEFNRKLRAQRHDFINHIQIVYSLLEMNEFNEAKNYLRQIYGDLEIVNRISRTEDVAFNALLQSKYSSAERRGIQMRIEITTSLKGFPMPSLDLCRVISNIIDNGIYSAETYKGEKKLDIVIKETLSRFIFEVTNTGCTIPEKNIPKLFNAGFTTKGKHGEGMGLYITKNIVERYGGAISIESENNSTKATVLLPKFPIKKRLL